MNQQNKANPKKRKGVVVSLKGEKTAIIKVDRMKTHRIYKKQYRVSKRYHVDTNNLSLNINDNVIIEEVKPISKLKSWKVLEIIKDKGVK